MLESITRIRDGPRDLVLIEFAQIVNLQVELHAIRENLLPPILEEHDAKHGVATKNGGPSHPQPIEIQFPHLEFDIDVGAGGFAGQPPSDEKGFLEGGKAERLERVLRLS